MLLGSAVGAHAKGYGWYNAGGNDVQNGFLSAKVYSDGKSVTKAKIGYQKKKGSGVSVKFGHQAVNKNGGAQGTVQWSKTYKIKPGQTRIVTISGRVS